MTTTNLLDKLFAAADAHGEDSGEPDHTIGDLQGLLRRAWSLMSISQQLKMLQSAEVNDLVEAGARDEFEAEDLEAEIRQKIAGMETEVIKAGYSFVQDETSCRWEAAGAMGTDFADGVDAIEEAYKHLQASQAAHA